MKIFGQVAAWNDGEGGGYDAIWVREGDAGADGTEVERGDASRGAFGQG